MTAEEYQRLKTKIEKLSRQRDMASGALKQTLQQIKREFGCNSLEQAEELLEQLNEEEREKAEAYEEADKRFREKWKDELERK